MNHLALSHYHAAMHYIIIAGDKRWPLMDEFIDKAIEEIDLLFACHKAVC